MQQIFWALWKKNVGCGIAAESYYLMLQDINCKQMYYVISPFSFITTKFVMPLEGLEHRTSCTLSENLTSVPYQTLLNDELLQYRLGNVLLKTNCVTDRYPGILSFCYSQQFHLTGWNLIVRMCLTIHQVLFASKQQVQDG